MLPDRINPSTVNWLGFVSGEFNNGLNWEAFDNPPGGPVVHRPPTHGDDVYFRPAPVYGPTPEYGYYPPTRVAFNTTFATALALNSLTITSYSGTVSVQDGMSAGTLVQTSGQINQLGSSYSGYDFYVTQTLNLTGGTFNGTANTGILHLQGVTTGLIGSVTTGSTVSVEAGTTLLYTGGTLGFANLSTMEIYAGSFVLPATSDQQGQFVRINAQPAAVQQPTLIRGGTFECTSDQLFGMKVESGTAYFNKSILIAGSAFADFPLGSSLAMTGGIITVKNGVNLTVQQGFSIIGGGFFTEHVQGLATGQTVCITGNMLVSGGTITLGLSAGQAVNFDALSVTGDVLFSGGEFKTKVNGTATSVERDLWRCTGAFTLRAEAKVSPTVHYAPPSGVPNRYWEVIIADSFFTDTTLPTMGTGWEASHNPAQTRLRVEKPSKPS